MVASGLPVKNGNKHAAEIATMALGQYIHTSNVYFLVQQFSTNTFSPNTFNPNTLCRNIFSTSTAIYSQFAEKRDNIL